MIKKYRRPYRVKKKKPIFRNRFFGLGILIFVVIVEIFYLICFSSFFQIKEIKISGNSAFAPASAEATAGKEASAFDKSSVDKSADKQKVSIEDIRNVIEKEVEQKFLFLPSKSIFLINLKEINEVVLGKFPQLAKINLKRSFPDTMLIEIEERKPAAIFCQKEHYFFIDGEGIIFEEVSGGEEYPKIKNSAINQPLNFGDRVVEKELLRLILETELKLRDDFKIPIGELLIVSDENVHAKTLEGWEIYFNPKGDLGWQLTKLKADLEEEILQEKRKDLEYIELRFGNFAPYKYRD